MELFNYMNKHKIIFRVLIVVILVALIYLGLSLYVSLHVNSANNIKNSENCRITIPNGSLDDIKSANLCTTN